VRAAGNWRERAVLTVRHAAEILSVSESHVRRRFELVRVLGVPRVRVADVLEALGEVVPKANVVSMRPNRRADLIVAEIRSGRR
jgi:hypothetical protein